ncbi:MAG: hypothetical protein AAGG75_02930 [Bacteroidota bacterium]
MRNYTHLLVLAFCLLCGTAFGQISQVEFGKNRVQYHQDFKEWVQYESRNFITYWYGEGRNIGQSVVQMAELDYEAIQNILEHRMNDKIEIIVYKDLTDLKQSNIGGEETFVNTGGQTKIVGNKIFVYFNGDHTHLREQVREGVASVYMNAMLFGSNLQEIVQNAVMMNLPGWFKMGLVSYVGREWSTELDNELRDIILRDEYEDFDKFADDYPALAGHSMWYYISQNYGRSTVSNLLYLTRINRSIDSGFLYVLGSSYRKTIEGWMRYFKQRYKAESQGLEKPEPRKIKIKNKRKLPLTQLKISPDGKKIAYVSNDIGKYKVYIQDIRTGDRKLVLKGGFRNAFQATDYNYPIIAWNPNNAELGVIYERRDIIKYLSYDLNTKESVTDVIPNQYHRIYSAEYINTSRMVFSATVRGFSDLFIFNTKNRQTERLTNDFYDDLDATVVNLEDKKGIIFASNRRDTLLRQQKLDTILPLNTFDLFFYDLEDRSDKLVRISATPLANERRPMAVDDVWFSYLSDESGIYNRRMGYFEEIIAYYEQVILFEDSSVIVLHQDSTLSMLDPKLIVSTTPRPVYQKVAFTHNNTNYNRNIITQHSAPKRNRLVESFFKDGYHQFYYRDMDPERMVPAKSTRFNRQRLKAYQTTLGGGLIPMQDNIVQSNVLEEVEDAPPIDLTEAPFEKLDTSKIDIDNYMFQSEFDDDETPAKVVVEEDDGAITLQQPEEEEIQLAPSLQTLEPRVMRFRPGRITPYRLKFRTDFVTTQLDNSQLFGGLDRYRPENDIFYPPPGILLKANFKDLFEDYEVEGGIRIPTTFNGAEYFLTFDDKKKRMDKRYSFYRRALRFPTELPGSFVPGKYEEAIIMAQYELRYPLDIFTSIRATTSLRFDRLKQLATDAQTLNQPSFNQQRLSLRLEYVFDNTLDVSVNIKNGTRYKFYVEAFKGFQIDLLDENREFSLNDGFMTLLGLDARHYQRLDKHSIFAIRAAGATTFGSERMLFLMGGVDNWLFSSRNNEIPFPTDGNFAFQSITTNLRGFRLNIRNGSSFALINTELRVPIFRYFSRRIRSSFFRNFQLIGFFDAGTAWQGTNPFSDENPLNTVFIEDPVNKVFVKVNYFRDPIVAGYGAGIRSMLFGYFVRLDYAWGIETRVVQDPILYFSLGMDF